MKRLMIGILVILFSGSAAFAGNSVTITVGCTIPAIPGVNAPPFPEGAPSVKADENASGGQEQKSYENIEYSVIVKDIREENTEEIKLADGRDASFTVQTVYSR